MTFLERNVTIMTVYTAALTWFMMRIVMICNQHIHCQSCHLIMSAKVNNVKLQAAASVYLEDIFSYRCHANAEVALNASF